MARQGRIFQMTLLSRILSLINVSKLFKARLPDLTQEGFAYDTMIFKGNVRNNLVVLDKGVINGVDMTLLLSGWVDPVHQTLSLQCFVSPLKSLDGIVQHLPVINTMFQGDVLSIPVTISGDLHHPQVMVLPPSQVTRGLLNTIKDILSTPLNLLKKGFQEATGKPTQ